MARAAHRGGAAGSGRRSRCSCASRHSCTPAACRGASPRCASARTSEAPAAAHVCAGQQHLCATSRQCGSQLSQGGRAARGVCAGARPLVWVCVCGSRMRSVRQPSCPAASCPPLTSHSRCTHAASVSGGHASGRGGGGGDGRVGRAVPAGECIGGPGSADEHAHGRILTGTCGAADRWVLPAQAPWSLPLHPCEPGSTASSAPCLPSLQQPASSNPPPPVNLQPRSLQACRSVCSERAAPAATTRLLPLRVTCSARQPAQAPTAWRCCL